jgi:hypothetical protein
MRSDELHAEIERLAADVVEKDKMLLIMADKLKDASEIIEDQYKKIVLLSQEVLQYRKMWGDMQNMSNKLQITRN